MQQWREVPHAHGGAFLAQGATGRWWFPPLSAHLLGVAVDDATLDPALFRQEIPLYADKTKKVRSVATPARSVRPEERAGFHVCRHASGLFEAERCLGVTVRAAVIRLPNFG